MTCTGNVLIVYINCFLLFQIIPLFFYCNQFFLIYLNYFIISCICISIIYSFLAVFSSCSIFPVTLAFFNKILAFFKRTNIYLGILISSDQPNEQVYCYLKILFLKTQKIDFYFITTPWIHPLNFIPVYPKSPITPLFICLI